MTGFSPSTVMARRAACSWPSSTCAAIPTAISSSFNSTAAGRSCSARSFSVRTCVMALDSAVWPILPLAEWQDTHDTVHMWTQIVGKTRLALAPRENHWWHVPLYVSARGLSTTAMPYRSGAFEVEFDFLDHRLTVTTSDGATRDIALRPQAVA